jgi:hypothetical protein
MRADLGKSRWSRLPTGYLAEAGSPQIAGPGPRAETSFTHGRLDSGEIDGGKPRCEESYEATAGSSPSQPSAGPRRPQD